MNQQFPGQFQANGHSMPNQSYGNQMQQQMQPAHMHMQHQQHQQQQPQHGDQGDLQVKSTRVYVGNLSWRTRWWHLKDHFSQCGYVVYANVFMQSNTHPPRSKGYGIVEFSSPAEAQLAIERLSNLLLDGRPLMLREDRDDKKVYGHRKLVVRNVGEMTGDELVALFSNAGKVANAENSTKYGTPCGIIFMDTEADALQAVAMFDGYKLDADRTLQVIHSK